ncbi:hypothetical protein JOF29_001029 [Kribbella aluminosa]|uniref:Uncharacterized protein n=1 Tax=Kribbella aluminosa TaxID=416017 RepID=A0ABS4UEE7_9ACTN|nr:hypothetical protein [Kribbella aluminosa]MBP2349946.1 hypothetical protein [Kribbella aluminosa]
MAKPLPAVGLVIGVVTTYVGMVGAAFAINRLMLRVQLYRNDFGQLPWLALLVAIAVVLGVLMMLPSIGAGVTTGTGLLVSVVGLAVMLLPIRQAVDLVRLFEFSGSRIGGAYVFFDGTAVLFGIPLLLVGIRRWAQDAKLAKLSQGPGYPQQPQQPQQQWGGYPGQQPQPPQQQYPPQYPGEQDPGQQQPPQYPGQQPRR